MIHALVPAFSRDLTSAGMPLAHREGTWYTRIGCSAPARASRRRRPREIAPRTARGDTPCRRPFQEWMVYDRGPYRRVIDYREPPPPPPLSEAEAVWVDAFLREQGLRGGSTDS